MIRTLPLLISVALLTGCTEPHTLQEDAMDFIPSKRVVTEKKADNAQQPFVKVNATFGYGNDPAVIKAYQQFTKQGVAQNINSENFQTLAYDAYSRPMISCAPLHLCVIQLERGESINAIALGDTQDWLIEKSFVGLPPDASYQIVIKPKRSDIATDMVITTNKRTYNVGLVSRQGDTTHIVNFYYPKETLQQSLENAYQLNEARLNRSVIAQSSAVDLAHLHFNYELTGDSPPWRPQMVFDDGTKTFIRMPPLSERFDLPVLYIHRDGKKQLINYRYRRPYYIVDGLFRKGLLVSGKGIEQAKVVIRNHNSIE